MTNTKTKKAERRTPNSKRSGTSTGRSSQAAKAPTEPNVSFGVAGKSGAQGYNLRGGSAEEFGTGNARKRLYAYGAQGTPLSAARQRTRVPADQPSPGKLSTDSPAKPKGATPESRYKKGGLVKPKAAPKKAVKKKK